MHEIIARNVNGLTRRRFLRRLAGFAALATATRYQDSSDAEEITGDALGQTLPRRPLGRTGEMVTMLGLGGFHVGILDDHNAQAVIEAAIEGGFASLTMRNNTAGVKANTDAF